MTTTAEKIEKLQRDILIMREDLDCFDAQLQEIAFNAESKPPNPEPLEFFVNLGPDEEIYETHRSLEHAKGCRGATIIHVRQVTPQDEQDAKDAARLRFLMTMDGVAWQPPGAGWLSLVKGNELREEIDKAMEEKND